MNTQHTQHTDIQSLPMAMDDRRQAELQHNKHAPSGQTSGVRSACSLEYSVHPSAMHEPSDMAEPTRGGTRVTTSIDAVPPTPHERSSLATLFAVTSIPHSDQLYAAENYKEAQGDGGHSIPAAFISAEYRSAYTGTVESPPAASSANEQPHSASPSAAAARELCGPWLEHAQEGYEGSSEQVSGYYVGNATDGLTAESPIMISPEILSNASSDGGDDVYDATEEDRGSVLLRSLAREKSWPGQAPLVLDSTDSKQAPHIVITPPSDSLAAEYCLCARCDRDWPSVPTQWPGHLVTPKRSDDIYAIEAMPPRSDMPQRPVLPEGHEVHEEHRERKPTLSQVFNAISFQDFIDSAAQERLVFYHVIPAVHRRCYKLAALAASEVAPSFRARWDSDAFRSHLEKPFRWTDPAYALLAEYAREKNTILIDSADPFVAPHIVIHEAPMQDYREIEEVFIPFQLCMYGRYLTLPHCECSGPCCQQYYFLSPTLASPPPAVEPVARQEVDDIVTFEAAGTVPCELEEIVTRETEELFESEDESDSGNDSDSSSDTPTTPQDGEFTDLPAELAKTEEAWAPQLDLYVDEEGDEDDLPPFDDWYQSIAQRAT